MHVSGSLSVSDAASRSKSQSDSDSALVSLSSHLLLSRPLALLFFCLLLCYLLACSIPSLFSVLLHFPPYAYYHSHHKKIEERTTITRTVEIDINMHFQLYVLRNMKIKMNVDLHTKLNMHVNIKMRIVLCVHQIVLYGIFRADLMRRFADSRREVVLLFQKQLHYLG